MYILCYTFPLITIKHTSAITHTDTAISIINSVILTTKQTVNNITIDETKHVITLGGNVVKKQALRNEFAQFSMRLVTGYLKIERNEPC